MLKKILVLILVCAAILTMTACGAETNKNSLTLMMKQSDSETNYVRRIIELYEEKTGNDIIIEAIPNNEFEEKVASDFEKGDLPDLFFHYNDTNLASYDIPANFYYMNDQEWKDELMDDVYKSCVDSEGNLLGLPFWENSLSGCYYNKNILDKLGLSPSSTQQEFNVLCTALTTVGDTPLYWAANDCNWMFQFGLDPIFANNPELLEKLNSNEITYADIPEVVDMVEWFDLANKSGWFNKNYADMGWDNVATAMANGEAVMIPVWDTWFETTLDPVDGKYSSKDFAVMPIFFNTVEGGTYEGGNMNILLANKNSPRLEQALEFLDFCAQPENYNAAFEGIPTVNVFKNQTTNIQSQMVTDAMPSIEAHRNVSVAVPMIVGYTQNDVGEAFRQLFDGEVDVAGCIKLMDEMRIEEARKLGVPGF